MANVESRYGIERVIIRIIGVVWCLLGIYKVVAFLPSILRPVYAQILDPRMFVLMGCFQLWVGWGLLMFKDFASFGIRAFALWIICTMWWMANGKFLFGDPGMIYFLGPPLFYLIFFNLPSVKTVFRLNSPTSMAAQGWNGFIADPVKVAIALLFIISAVLPFFVSSIRRTGDKNVSISPDNKLVVSHSYKKEITAPEYSWRYRERKLLAQEKEIPCHPVAGIKNYLNLETVWDHDSGGFTVWTESWGGYWRDAVPVKQLLGTRILHKFAVPGCRYDFKDTNGQGYPYEDAYYALFDPHKVPQSKLDLASRILTEKREYLRGFVFVAFMNNDEAIIRYLFERADYVRKNDIQEVLAMFVEQYPARSPGVHDLLSVGKNL